MATMISKNGVLAVHPGWYIKEYLRYNAIPTSELAKQKRNTKLFVLLANLEFMNYTKYVIYDY